MLPQFLAILLFSQSAIAAVPAWWTKQKTACGLSSTTAYNTWVANGSPCNKGSSGTSGSLEKDLGKQLGTMIGQEIVKGIMGDPAEKARKAALEAEKRHRAKLRREELAQKLAEQNAEEQRKKEQAKQRLQGQLKGTESGGLTLKTGMNEGPFVAGLKLKTGDDPEHLARGGRVVDCEHTRDIYNKMSPGLPAQKEMLQKYREQIDSAKKERVALSEEARTQAIKAAYDEARNLAKSLSAVRARLKNLKLDGLSAQKRKEWMSALDGADKFYDGLDKLPNAAEAGVKYGQDLPSIGQGLQEQAIRLNKLLVESGIAEQTGEELAKYGFGPAGALTFRVVKLGIDSSFVLGKQVLNEDELAVAKDTYENLESSYKRNVDTVERAKADLAELCAQRP